MWSGTGSDRRLERRLPVCVGLVGRAVDQIEVHVLEAGGARLGDGLLGTSGPVPAVEHLEDVRRGRLHAQRDSGEPGLAQPGEVARRDGLGVRLGRDLDVGGEPEPLADLAHDQPEVLGGQQAGRAAAEEDRAHRRDALAQASPSPRTSAASRNSSSMVSTYVPRLTPGAEFGRGVGVEVAVAAAGIAERDVRVDPERARPRRCPASPAAAARRAVQGRRAAMRRARPQCATRAFAPAGGGPHGRSRTGRRQRPESSLRHRPHWSSAAA